MKKIKIEEIIKGYEMDSIAHPKNAPTNKLVIKMLKASNLEYLTVEPTRSGAIYNRGSVVECVVRAIINEYVKGYTSNHYKKSSNGEDLSTKKKSIEMLNDLGLTTNKTYEIKLLSSLARASFDNANKSDYILMVDIRAKSKGVYLLRYEDIILYNKNSIKDYTKGKKLNTLGGLMGL